MVGDELRGLLAGNDIVAARLHPSDRGEVSLSGGERVGEQPHDSPEDQAEERKHKPGNQRIDQTKKAD